MLRKNRLLLGFVACWSFAGCTVGPDVHLIETNIPDSFVSVSQRQPSPDQPVTDATRWWQALNDPELDLLIDRAVKGNNDVEIALDRMQEARIGETLLLGEALPQAEFSFGGGAGSGSDLARGRASGPLVSSENSGGLQQVTQVGGFDAAWELDLFGKYRREAEAAEYTTQAATAARNAVVISVIGDVARAYIDMRALQMQVAVLQKNAKTLQNYLTLAQQRFNRGITNELDVTLAQRQLSSLQAQQAPLEAQMHAAQYVIATLLGQFPEDVAEELENTGMVPQLPENIEAGLPVDLLRRRPDIEEANRNAAEATARVGVATADLFPHVALTGAAGVQGMGLASAATSSFIWSLGPSVSWALLDFGTLDAEVDIADLRSKEMLLHYKQTVLDAVREVDTSVDAYKGQQDRLRDLGTALAASRRAVSLANQRFARGLTDSLNVIDAERQEYDLEAQYVSAQQSAAEQYIALYQALGGGWEQYQSFPPIHQPQPAVIAAFDQILGSQNP